MSVEEQAEALLTRAHELLSELFPPAGVLMFWSSPIAYLGDRRPCDLWRDRDLGMLETMCERLEAMCDGSFS